MDIVPNDAPSAVQLRHDQPGFTFSNLAQAQTPTPTQAQQPVSSVTFGGPYPYSAPTPTQAQQPVSSVTFGGPYPYSAPMVQPLVPLQHTVRVLEHRPQPQPAASDDFYQETDAMRRLRYLMGDIEDMGYGKGGNKSKRRNLNRLFKMKRTKNMKRIKGSRTRKFRIRRSKK
jgi:hypothetical protein